MSSTTPLSPWNVIRSPMRIGWLMAMSTPATALASVCRAAKPTTRPSTADEASTPVARRLTAANWLSASASPMTMIAANTSRRTSRRRVLATGESSAGAPGRTDRRLPPRLAIARSTTCASTTAATIVMMAVRPLRCWFQNEAAIGRVASGMRAEAIAARGRGGVEAVLLDAFGTLVSMEPPAPHLRAALGAAGFEVSEERAAAAFAAEIAYYVEHHVEGGDPAALDALRDRCAEVLRDALELPGLDPAAARGALLGSIRFAAFADAAPALRELRRRGLRLVVASNWDCSLPAVLAAAGLAPLVDGVVASATVGAAKPAREFFDAALECAGVAAERAVYVGDSPDMDIAGAAGAGIPALLLRRGGGSRAGEIETLAQLPHVI